MTVVGSVVTTGLGKSVGGSVGEGWSGVVVVVVEWGVEKGTGEIQVKGDQLIHSPPIPTFRPPPSASPTVSPTASTPLCGGWR